MTEHYFLILELPCGSEMKFEDSGLSPKNFWGEATKALNSRTAKIISRRNDTGVAEELRAHVSSLGRFTTFLLVSMQLCPCEDSEVQIYNKAASWIRTPGKEIVVDASDKFQLVSIDA